MNSGWLALALAVVALAIVGYALLLGARRRRLARRIDELEAKSSENSL